MSKRKAEVLADDTKANAAPLRRTRSSGLVSPEISTTSMKPSTRSAKAAPAVAPQPAKAKVTKTYGRRTRSILPSAALDADEETQPATEEPQTEPAGMMRGAKRKLVMEEKDTGSSSSKENSRNTRNTRKSARGRAEVGGVGSNEDEQPGESEEPQVRPPKTQKRRKITPSGIPQEPAAPGPATRSRRSATTVPTSTAEPEPAVRRRGRPAKAKASQQTLEEEEVVEPSPLVNTPSSPEIPAPTRSRGRLRKAKADPSPTVAVDEDQASPEEPLSPEIAVATPRKVAAPNAKAAKAPVHVDEDDVGSEDDAHSHRRSQRKSGTAASVGKRRRSPAVAAGDGTPKKRRETVEPSSREESPLFSEPEEQTDLTHAAAPSSPSKKRAVAVEVEPRTPRRSRVTRATADSDEEIAEPPTSPVKQPVIPATPSHRLRNGAPSAPNSPTKAGNGASLIQEHLIPCLNAQKRAVLRALSNPPISSTIGEKVKGKGKAKANEDDDDFDNATAYRQLKDLLEGTTIRNEGNSCLLLGPRGSGKTRVRYRHHYPTHRDLTLFIL